MGAMNHAGRPPFLVLGGGARATGRRPGRSRAGPRSRGRARTARAVPRAASCAAESIRSGLGQIDAAVTSDKLAEALESLLAEARSLNADQVFKRARRQRDRLDEAGIAAREKQAHGDRYLKAFRLSNGIVRLNGLFAPEDGEFVLSVLDSITAPRRGGVRFVDTEEAAWAKRIQDDPRTTDQIAADGVLLCHPHHLLLHNQHWAIIRTGTEYWLRPPVEVDPEQKLIALPSKSAEL